MNGEDDLGYQVELFVYDLSRGIAKTMSPALLGKEIEGVWHTGVVAYGREYFFGSGGIQSCRPGGTILGEPDRVEELGESQVPYPLFLEYIFGLGEATYKPGAYDLFKHNCNHFSDEVSNFLCGQGIPKPILTLPDEVLNTSLGETLSSLVNDLDIKSSGSRKINFTNYNNNVHTQAPTNTHAHTHTHSESPDLELERLNQAIDQVRQNTIRLEDKRNSINEKVNKLDKKKREKREKKEKKEKKKKRKSKTNPDSQPPGENSVAQTSTSSNPTSDLPRPTQPPPTSTTTTPTTTEPTHTTQDTHTTQNTQNTPSTSSQTQIETPKLTVTFAEPEGGGEEGGGREDEEQQSGEQNTEEGTPNGETREENGDLGELEAAAAGTREDTQTHTHTPETEREDANFEMEEELPRQEAGGDYVEEGGSGQQVEEVEDARSSPPISQEPEVEREPPITFRDDANAREEFECLVSACGSMLTDEEAAHLDELKSYILEDEGSWALGDNFSSLLRRVLHDGTIPDEARVHLVRLMAAAALKDDVILLLHQDRRDHTIMNYANRVEFLCNQQQEALALFFCNMFEHVSPSEWLLYISEWQDNTQPTSNIRVTTKIAVNALLNSNPKCQEYGSAIMYNLGTKEVKTVVFDDVAPELAMAILQFFSTHPQEEMLWRTMAALCRFTYSSTEVPALIKMIGPDPNTFKGVSERVDNLIEEIDAKLSRVRQF